MIDNDAMEKLLMVSELTEHLRIKSGVRRRGKNSMHSFLTSSGP